MLSFEALEPGLTFAQNTPSSAGSNGLPGWPCKPPLMIMPSFSSYSFTTLNSQLHHLAILKKCHHSFLMADTSEIMNILNKFLESYFLMLPDICGVDRQDPVTHSQFSCCGGCPSRDDFTDINSLNWIEFEICFEKLGNILWMYPYTLQILYKLLNSNKKGIGIPDRYFEAQAHLLQTLKGRFTKKKRQWWHWHFNLTFISQKKSNYTNPF